MRARAWLLAALAASPARASEPLSGFLPRFDLETGRAEAPSPELGATRASLHGELQLRGLHQGSVAQLTPADPSGQSGGLRAWLRATPRLQLSTRAELVAQADASPAAFDPRWLYAELTSGAWRLSAGQQPVHLGVGMVFNDGDHPSLFGDYRQGDSAERIMATLRPGGRTGRLRVWAAGDLIRRDPRADLADDTALRATVGVLFGGDVNQLGAALAARRQRGRDAVLPGFFDTQLLDLHGRFAARAPGSAAYLFGEGELALQRGEATFQGVTTPLQSWGAALRLGLAHESPSPQGRFADAVASVGWGFASGDGDPHDGVDRRFAMHPSYNVGLVLFRLPGVPLAGVSYANPTLTLRPRRWLDLKLGLLVAQATGDLVDHERLALGQRVNPRGGPVGPRDLGLELDAGVELRVPLYGTTLQLGAQAGLLRPGHALDDAAGAPLPPQHVEALRAGLQY